ncbi:hypothetical protein GRJ2_003257500 [Grus japonensis]|uniref:ribonuclease H n=1 Tax=Grus japonensis TaxID=30415 RepID=A0ABC9YCY2_GRUJA
MPSSYEGVGAISISGVTGGSQQLTLLEAEVSLTGNDWEKHPIVTGPEALCILGIDYLRRGYFKDPKGYRWAFGRAALEAEEIEPLSTLPGLSEDPSVAGLLRAEEQLVPIATTTVHRRQYRTNRDSLVPIHKLIRQLEGQGVISRTHSPFNSPIWPVRKSNGEWRLTVDYRGLNEVTPPMSAAVPDMLELQYELESKAAKWGVQYTWNRLPQGWKHSPTICHGVIQTALEQGEAPEHLQYIDDIIVWGNTAEEVSEKGKKIIQILLKAGFTIKRRKRSRIGSPSRPGILEVIMDWPEGKDFGMSPEEEVTCAEEAPPYNKLPEDEKPYALFTDGSCRIMGKHQRWKAAVWSPTHAARLEKLVVKVPHVDAHVPKSRAAEEHQNNQAAKIEVAQVDLDWQPKGELFIARWAHDTSGHQGRDATYRWARDRGVDLSMDAISQVIHQCETCAAIKQAKRVKPLWYGGRWLKYKYGEAWQIDYITLPQTRQGKCYVIQMMEATTGWLETYPVPHATARNTILGLEKQVLWQHGTPERIESDNGTHFWNNLIDTWAKEHGIEWVYHIPYHAPASGKIEPYSGLLKATLRAMGGGTLKHWDTHLAKATWLVNTRGSANQAGPAQSKLPCPVEGDKVPVVRMKNMLGKTVWVIPASGKGKPICGIAFAQGPGCTWWVMRKDGEVRCVPQGDLILSENSQ